jgi:hypothetical protein
MKKTIRIKITIKIRIDCVAAEVRRGPRGPQ